MNGGQEVPASPFNVPLSTTSAFKATPQAIARALSVCVSPLANAVSVVVTGQQTGTIYGSQVYQNRVGIITVGIQTEVDTDYTVAVTANAIGALTVHVIGVADAPPWGTLIVRGETETNNSPFHVNVSSGVTKSCTPSPTAHALAILLTSYLNAAVLDIIGVQTGTNYLTRALNLNIGCIIVPIVTAVDQSYNVTVQTNSGGATDVHVVGIDDVAATGIYTEVPIMSTPVSGTIKISTQTATFGTSGQGTGIAAPLASIPGVAGKVVHITQAMIGLVCSTAGTPGSGQIRIKTLDLLTQYVLTDLWSTGVAGTVDRMFWSNLTAAIGVGIGVGFPSTIPTGTTGYVSVQWYYE